MDMERQIVNLNVNSRPISPKEDPPIESPSPKYEKSSLNTSCEIEYDSSGDEIPEPKRPAPIPPAIRPLSISSGISGRDSPRMSRHQEPAKKKKFGLIMGERRARSIGSSENDPSKKMQAVWNGAKMIAVEAQYYEVDERILSFVRGEYIYLLEVRPTFAETTLATANQPVAIHMDTALDEVIGSDRTGFVVGYIPGTSTEKSRFGLMYLENVEIVLVPSAPSAESNHSVYGPMVQLLISQGVNMVSVLSSVFAHEELESVSRSLADIFYENGNIMELLKILIEYEVTITLEAPTLFRMNCVASKAMTHFCRKTGGEYVKKILEPLVKMAIESPSVEVDPKYIPEAGGDAFTNSRNLRKLALEFVRSIAGSISICPKEIRNMCYLLRKSVEGKFPQSKLIVVGALVFLRFISPALVSPENAFTTEIQIDPKTRRTLLLISKVLQHMANDSVQTFKEEHMFPFNDFVKEHSKELLDFFDALSSDYFELPPVSSRSKNIEDQIDINLLHKLYYQICYNLFKFHRECSKLDKIHDYFEPVLFMLSKTGAPKNWQPFGAVAHVQSCKEEIGPEQKKTLSRIFSF